MLPTLQRYYLKRWLAPTAGACCFFGGLILANEVVALSRSILVHGAPLTWLLPLAATALPEVLTMVLPMAAVLGGLLGTQALSESSELVAAQGLGVGLGTLLKPWLLIAGLLVAVSSVNAHLLTPRVGGLQTWMQQRMLEDADLRVLRPGGPPWAPPAEADKRLWVAPGGEVHFLEVTAEGVQHLLARHLSWVRMFKDGQPSVLRIQLQDLQGSRLDKASGKITILKHQDSMTLEFGVPATRHGLGGNPIRRLSTRALFGLEAHEARVELSHRLALPFAAAALLLVGIALGLNHPRFHRGGALARSLAVLLVYFILLQGFEQKVLSSSRSSLAAAFALPLLFFAAGLLLLARKLRPHRAHRWPWVDAALRRARGGIEAWRGVGTPRARPLRTSGTRGGILGRWSRGQWWGYWAAVAGTFLTLSLVFEFLGLAADLARNGSSLWLFLGYWVCAQPAFLATVLPMVFLLAGVLVFSRACQSREWLALRAGGVSLWRWLWAGAGGWLTILALTLGLQVALAPSMLQRAHGLRRRLLNHAEPARRQPWVFQGSERVLWFLDEASWWGFPLGPPGRDPILVGWRQGDTFAQVLPWQGAHLVRGAQAEKLLPDLARHLPRDAEEASTLDLFRWQAWAPDPERATLLWGRLLNWLAGPCLLFAVLSYAFPEPRRGAGQALGHALVAGLLFLGLQIVFSAAARVGQLPPVLGVMAPILILVGFGFQKLHLLRT